MCTHSTNFLCLIVCVWLVRESITDFAPMHPLNVESEREGEGERETRMFSNSHDIFFLLLLYSLLFNQNQSETKWNRMNLARARFHLTLTSNLVCVFGNRAQNTSRK